MRRLFIHRASLLLWLVVSLLWIQPTLAAGLPAAEPPAVRAVLFFSPFCPHCHTVIEQDLPPLQAKYGDQLKIFQVDVTKEEGQKLYQTAVQELQIPEDHLGVPTLIVGSMFLVGSAEIPERLPGIIDEALKGEGLPWPQLTGLTSLLPPEDQAEIAAAQDPITGPTWRDKFMHDPFANSLAVVMLVIMLATAAAVGYAYVMDAGWTHQPWPSWVIPVLSVLGLGVAIYLSYVEVGQRQAICGPVGDCNTVQQSPYAKLFGVLPVGILGALGYIGILLAFLIQRYGPSSLHKLAALGIWAMAWFGLLFSIYLTFLEPFVIGATCMWCLTSALIMTLMLWASTPAALAALRPDENLLDEQMA